MSYLKFEKTIVSNEVIKAFNAHGITLKNNATIYDCVTAAGHNNFDLDSSIEEGTTIQQRRIESVILTKELIEKLEDFNSGNDIDIDLIKTNKEMYLYIQNILELMNFSGVRGDILYYNKCYSFVNRLMAKINGNPTLPYLNKFKELKVELANI